MYSKISKLEFSDELIEVYALLTLQNTSTEDTNNKLDNPVELNISKEHSSNVVAVKIFKLIKTH